MAIMIKQGRRWKEIAICKHKSMYEIREQQRRQLFILMEYFLNKQPWNVTYTHEIRSRQQEFINYMKSTNCAIGWA